MRKVFKLNDRNFYDVTQAVNYKVKDSWIILFTRRNCIECNQFEQI